MQNQLSVVEQFTIDCEKVARQIINLKAYSFAENTKVVDNTIPLISTEHNTLQQYSNAVYMKLAVEANYRRMTVVQQQLADNLTALLKKEYHLENE